MEDDTTAAAGVKGKLQSNIISDLVGFFFRRIRWSKSEAKHRTGTRSNRHLKMAKNLGW